MYADATNGAAVDRFEAVRGRCLEVARAATRKCGRAAVSHSPAAVTYGLPIIGRPRPCVTVTAGTPLRRLTRVHLHRATLTASDVVAILGYPTTSPARTVLDIARERGVDAGVAAADAALRLGLVGPDDLARALESCAGWPGRAAARRTVEWCDGDAESALESLSRLRMRSCGLPVPVLQAEIGDPTGGFVGRCDFYWPECGVVGECDGELKYDTRAVLIEERRRERALRQLGLVVVRWGWADLGRFESVAAELRAAFARGQRPGTGRRWSVLCGPSTPLKPALHSNSSLSHRG